MMGISRPSYHVTFWRTSSTEHLKGVSVLPVVQVYISGHGGDGFMKFQDKEEVTSDEIGAAFALVSPCSQFATHWPAKGGGGGGVG